MLIFGTGFLVGIFLGSLTYCLALRSLANESFWGRSRCPICKHKLSWLDLVPLLSYILLLGRCRYCKKNFPPIYIGVEVLLGILIGLLFLTNFQTTIFAIPFWWLSPAFLENLLKIFILCVFVSVVITDLSKGLIPDRITYPSIAFVLISSLLLSIYKIILAYFSFKSNLVWKYLLPPFSSYFYHYSLDLLFPFVGGIISAIIISIFFGGLIFFTKGRGMGGGDLKLGVFIGLALGFPNSLLAILMAFFSGSVIGVVMLLLRKKSFGQTIPFGPFLSFGSLVTLFWGEAIINWYLKFKF